MSRVKLVNFRLPAGEWEAFKTEAESRGSTASEALRGLVRSYTDVSSEARAAEEAAHPLISLPTPAPGGGSSLIAPPLTFETLQKARREADELLERAKQPARGPKSAAKTPSSPKITPQAPPEAPERPFRSLSKAAQARGKRD